MGGDYLQTCLRTLDAAVPHPPFIFINNPFVWGGTITGIVLQGLCVPLFHPTPHEGVVLFSYIDLFSLDRACIMGAP